MPAPLSDIAVSPESHHVRPAVRVALVFGAVAVLASVLAVGRSWQRHFAAASNVASAAVHPVSEEAGTMPSAPGATGSATSAPPQVQRGSSPALPAPSITVPNPYGDALAGAVDPGLVDVVATTTTGDTVLGTGLVLTPSGLVLTNDHVVAGATDISATDVGNGGGYVARVVGADPSHDIAVLQLDEASGLATIEVSPSSPAPGQTVVAFGNAGGSGGVPAEQSGTVGLLGAAVAAVNDITGSVEDLDGLVQASVAVVAGDSGGALVDTSGRVVGMVTAYGSSGPGAQGFAIPIGQALAYGRRLSPNVP